MLISPDALTNLAALPRSWVGTAKRPLDSEGPPDDWDSLKPSRIISPAREPTIILPKYAPLPPHALVPPCARFGSGCGSWWI